MDWKVHSKRWLNNKNLEGYLKEQLIKMNEQELEEAFYKNLEFGTGGMRGEVGPGTNKMNIYTIRKANVGFAQYLLENFKDAKERGVVIAYDCRHYSTDFAMESAKVMASYGIKAYIFDELRPTPELSFAVRYLNAIGGIVVTASHNPPQYNGYKIYDKNGCQLVPKLIDKVIKLVEKVDDVFNLNIDTEENLRNKNLITTVGKEIDDAYVKKVKTIQINKELDKSDIKIVFSPLHGTANVLGQRILNECGYQNVYPVKSQCVMDPDFTTVKSPNPEDGEAFSLAISLGEEVDADILIATDPDADRVGIAVKGQNNKYVLLTGNQTGAILIKYILSQRKANNSLPNEGIIFNTIVTSSLGASIASKYGLEVESTLTGFKFIGEKAHEIEDTKKEFIFGYEESYGYLISDFVRDKDSIQSLLMCCEAATYYKKQNKTLFDVLFDLYKEHGYFIESLVNIKLKGIEGKAKITKILDYFRNNDINIVANEEVVALEDYLFSVRKDKSGESLISLPKSNVLKYFLSDGSWFVIRPSGTEPKMKIYVSVKGKDLKEAEVKNQMIKDFVVEEIDKIV